MTKVKEKKNICPEEREEESIWWCQSQAVSLSVLGLVSIAMKPVKMEIRDEIGFLIRMVVVVFIVEEMMR